MALVVLCAGLGTVALAATPLVYLGQQIVPTRMMQLGTVVGGLSGLDYDPVGGRYFAISDDRSELQPARYYELTLELRHFARLRSPGHAGVTFLAVHTLLTPAGGPFGAFEVDPESIRFDGTSLYWVSEGARSPSGYQRPFVRQMTRYGVHLREYDTPAHFLPRGTPAGSAPGDSGIRHNLSFESLALDVERGRLYIGTENALVQDGPPATLTTASVARVIELDIASGRHLAEYAYVVDPVPAAPMPPGRVATNGLVDLLALGELQFIAVERSFSAGVGNSIRLYYADARQASDVSGWASLEARALVPIAKTLLLDLAELRNDDGTPVRVDNIEGIARGPVYQGKPTLILVSDDNFSPRQVTQFIALQLDIPLADWLKAR